MRPTPLSSDAGPAPSLPARLPARGTCGGRLGFALLVAVALARCTTAGKGVGPECQATSGVRALCGVNKPEDLLQLGDSGWVLTGNMGSADWKGGGFYAVRIADKAFHPLTPDLSGPAAPAYRDCPGAPEPGRLSAHGLALRAGADGAQTLYAVNHGGRESVEVYDVRLTEGGPLLSWAGCVVLPEGHAANAVAPLPDGGLAVTVPHHPSSWSDGKVLRWAPGGAGWSEVPGTRFRYDNGLLVSPDGAWLYVSEYLGMRLHKVPLAGAPGPARSVALGFRPDNLRFAPDGALLATGHPGNLVRIGVCLKLECGFPTEVARVDPDTLQATTVFARGVDDTFSSGTSAIVVGEELWLGSFQARSLLVVPFASLQAPVLPAPVQQAPANGR
jgi:hypothetical protein